MSKWIVAALAAATVCSANAQVVVANDQTGTASIYVINVTTGVSTALYTSTNANAKAWGMAADNVNNRLYWNNGGSLHSATFASLLSGTPTISTVSLTFNGSATNFVGLGYNPTTGKLLGTRNIATESVYEIDPLTGISTILHSHPTTFDFGGLDYDAGSGKLYGLSDTGPTGGVRGLYHIESAATQNFISPYPAGETDIDGLAVGGGRAYYITDGPNTTQASMYVFDIASGTQVGTLASPFTGSGTFSAGAWAPGLLVPEPGTVIALTVGSLAILARRRKRS